MLAIGCGLVIVMRAHTLEARSAGGSMVSMGGGPEWVDGHAKTSEDEGLPLFEQRPL